MDFKDIAQKVAQLGLPTVGAALGGPAGALIGKALAGVIGKPEATAEDVVSTLTYDVEARFKAREFEAQHELELKKLVIEEKKLENDDRSDARKRESSVKDNTNRILAFTVIGSFVAVVVGSLLGYAKIDSAMLGTLVGYLSAKAEQVIAYYFGSTSGSQMKTQLLADKK